MHKIKYLFISRKSSHFRYYQRLVNDLGEEAALVKLKRFTFPRFKYSKDISNLDLNDLVDVHVRRKQVRYPWLDNNPTLQTVLKRLYIIREWCRASYYFSLFDKHPCTTVILWNGMKQPNRTPYIVAMACGKKTQLFENGVLPNTTTLDPKGVNAMNSMPRDADFYRNWHGKVKRITPQLVPRQAHKKRKVTGKDIDLPKRYIFVPFQVPNDTQVVCHSSWVKTMPAFYKVLEDALGYLNECEQWQKFTFVVKEHPSWPHSFTELHQRNSDIIFANDNNTQDLITSALAVVTLNSTVGIEALLLGKKVITLGDAFFNIEGLVSHCANQQQFNQALQYIEHTQVESDLVEGFLGYLENEYLIPQSWSNSTLEQSHFDAVKRKLKSH